MKRILLITLAMLSIASVLAKDNYQPVCTHERDYTYTNGKYTLNLSTIPSEHSGYVWFDREELFPYNTRLREEGSLVLKYFPMYKKDSGWVEQAKENFKTLGSDFVYFDYNLQVGDTLCVVDMTKYDYKEIYGRIIKVLSIDTIDIEYEPRLRYNLESRCYFVSIGEKHKDEYIFSKVINNTPYNDSWIEGIGYTSYNFDRNTLELKTLYDNGTLMYGEEDDEESSYLPTCVPQREYIYDNSEQGEKSRENTFLSELSPGYIAYNEDGYGNTVLRENQNQILKNFSGLTTDSNMIKLLNENLTTANDDFVYFDYNLQIGDTLCVVDRVDTQAGEYEAHLLKGKIIKVLSVDTIEQGMQSRLRYNLESRPFSAYLAEHYDDASLPPGERVYEYTYGIEMGEIFNDAWIEGIGYTSIVYPDEDLSIEEKYELQCVFEEGNLIYCVDGADCNGLSDSINKKIDFSNLTLYRQGDVLMAVFPAASAGEAITLYDATGRVVATQAVRPGATTATIDVAALPAGVYIARMGNGALSKIVI